MVARRGIGASGAPRGSGVVQQLAVSRPISLERAASLASISKVNCKLHVPTTHTVEQGASAMLHELSCPSSSGTDQMLCCPVADRGRRIAVK